MQNKCNLYLFSYIIMLGFMMVLSETAFADNTRGHLRLADILRQAYESNPALLAAREELKGTRELYPQARAGWLPSVQGEGSIYATDIESSNFSAGTGATTKDMTLSLDQPIWRGGITFAETARARDMISAGEAVLKQVEQDVFLEIATIYINLIRDAKILSLRMENEQILLSEWKAAWERWKGGALTVTDVEQTRARYLSAHSSYIEARNDFDNSKAEFEELTTIPVPKALYMPQIDFEFPSTVEEMIDLAEKRNPEIHVFQFQQYAAEHDVDALFREMFPKISAFASYNKQYDPQPGIVSDSETETVGLRATISFFEGGAMRSRVRQAKNDAKRQEYAIQDTIRRLRQEVIGNWRTYQSARQKMKIQKEEIQAAEKALIGIREEARMGARTILDILDADRDVINAKSGLVDTRRDELVAKLSLAHSLGLLSLDNIMNYNF